MFGQKTTPASSSTNNNPANNLDIENLPIHTMAEDLEQIKNPNAFKNQPSLERKNKPIIPRNLNQKQQSSPFLQDTSDDWNNRSILNEKIETQEPIKNNLYPPIQTEEQDAFPTDLDMEKIPEQRIPEIKSALPEENPAFEKEISTLEEDSSSTGLNWKIVALIAISLILLFALIWSAYSYFKNKNNPEETPEESPIETTIPVSTPETTPTTAPQKTPGMTYSQDNPNYLLIGLEITDAEKIKAIINGHTQKVAQEGYKKPVEFIITDEKNAPITFKMFSDKLGLGLSPQIIDSLGDNFSFFIYNDNAVSRVGLIIDSKNDSTLSATLLQEEANLADQISPIFFTTDYKKDKLFNSSEYGGAKIRYQNIISPDTLSVDYTVLKNKLIIGTTKMTLRSIIDHLNGTGNVSATLPQ